MQCVICCAHSECQANLRSISKRVFTMAEDMTHLGKALDAVADEAATSALLGSDVIQESRRLSDEAGPWGREEAALS
jgi:hypothetical protein